MLPQVRSPQPGSFSSVRFHDGQLTVTAFARASPFVVLAVSVRGPVRCGKLSVFSPMVNAFMAGRQFLQSNSRVTEALLPPAEDFFSRQFKLPYHDSNRKAGYQYWTNPGH